MFGISKTAHESFWWFYVRLTKTFNRNIWVYCFILLKRHLLYFLWKKKEETKHRKDMIKFCLNETIYFQKFMKFVAMHKITVLQYIFFVNKLSSHFTRNIYMNIWNGKGSWERILSHLNRGKKYYNSHVITDVWSWTSFQMKFTSGLKNHYRKKLSSFK